MTGKTYKLKYFPIAALGEPIRFMLSYAGIKFDDIRVPRNEWPAMKPHTPFGKMPTLEVEGGKVLHQTKAIVRYLAKGANLAGSNDWESLEIDMAVETIDDLRLSIGSYFYDSIEASKAAKKEPLFKETIPFYLQRLDAQVKANGGYFVNSKLSWADIYFVSIVFYMSYMAGVENVIAGYTNLQNLHDKVMALPKIANYVAKRPASEL